VKRLNKTFIIGAILAVSVVVAAILFEIQGMSAAVFLHPAALLIVFGGTLASALISMPFKELRRVIQRTYYAIVFPKDNFIETLQEIVKISVGVNKDVLFLEKQTSETKNIMLRDGLSLIAMGFKTDDIKRFMEIKKDQNENALSECSIFYFSMGKMGPAFGLLGTLVGLIILLYYHMGDGDMEKVASSMGVALTATLYGVGIANMVFSPLADYMQYNSERGAELDHMIIEAVVQIKERRHPVFLLQALKSYLPREDYPALDSLMKTEMAQSRSKDRPEAAKGASSAKVE
jgi:chemotaxis protein MotA